MSSFVHHVEQKLSTSIVELWARGGEERDERDERGKKGRGGEAKKQKEKENCSNQDSRVVPHRSTN